MTGESFFNYRKFLWLKVTLVIILISTGLYIFAEPSGGHRGGTWLGYTLGGLSGLGMIFLMWYGVRKRAYHSRYTTLQSVLSAHVWFGLGLVILVPLHSGFRAGFNIHGIAYYLLILTVLTGIWGALNYTRLASHVLAHRGEGTVAQLMGELDGLSGDASRLLRDKSDEFLVLASAIDFSYSPGILRSLFSLPPGDFDKSRIARLMLNVPDSERDEAVQLVSMNNRKRSLVRKLHQEVSVQALLKLWLYTHIPLAVACFLVFILHVVLVFQYY